MKLELDLTPQEVEALRATLEHFGSVAAEKAKDYVRGSSTEVFHSNSAELLRGLSVQLTRQEGGPAFSITPLGDGTSELRSPIGKWVRTDEQLNDIRTSLVTHSDLHKVLAPDQYRDAETRAKYSNVPDHVWGEHKEMLQVVAADLGLDTELNKKDLSLVRPREPTPSTPEERFGQQRSITPERIQSVLMGDLEGEFIYHHKGSNGIELNLAQDGNRVTIERRVDGNTWPVYESHQETEQGLQPGIKNMMSAVERESALEALETLEQSRQLEGPGREFLEAFSQGIEQLKQDSPDMAGLGGGVKARIQHNLEVLKRTNDELAGRGEGDLKELFDRADQIMDKAIYDETPDIPPLTTERQVENKAFFDAVEKATLQQGELKEGFSKLDLGDSLTALAVPGDVVISRQDAAGNNSVLYEQSRDTAHLSGIGETYSDKLDNGLKSSILQQVQGLGKSKDDAHLAQKFHKVAEVEGYAISGGYRYQGKTVTIESNGPKNLTVTRNLDNSVAFQRQQGQTQQKNLSSQEIKTLNKAYEGLELDRER